MNKKHKTEELVRWTKNLCTWDMEPDTLIRDAIIARLRAADKLCKAAKCISWDAGPDVLNDFDTTLFRMVTSRANIRDFRKAIAEYEGNLRP